MACYVVTQAELEAMQTHTDANKGINDRMSSLGARVPFAVYFLPLVICAKERRLQVLAAWLGFHNHRVCMFTEEVKAQLEEHKAKMVAAIAEGKASLAASKKELDASIGNHRRAGYGF